MIAYPVSGARQTLLHTVSIAIYLNNELLKLVDNQKLLGITIDNTLRWATQVDNVCQNVTKRMKLLSKHIAEISLNQYYNSNILPILDYECMPGVTALLHIARDYLNSKNELRGL